MDLYIHTLFESLRQFFPSSSQIAISKRLWYLVWDGELLFSKVMPRPFETELACEVKSYDVDFVGYVHNAVYLRWLEDLRTAMLAAYYPLERFAHQGQSPILTRTTMQYKKPLQLFDRFTGRVWATQLAGVRWEMSHELIHNGQIAAIAEQSGMFINLNTHRPVAVPPELLHKFQEFQSP